jgi:CHAT domain-containing protein/Tfp pilus assembly protein PilF
MKYLLFKNMKLILILFITLLPFLSQSQENQNVFKELKDKITQFEKLGDTTSSNYMDAIYDLSQYYYKQRDYNEAEPLFLKITEINKNLYGEKNKKYLVSLNNLAVLYHTEEKFKDAEIIYLKTIEIGKEILSDKHPDYLSFLNSLSILYQDEGNYAKAEPIILNVLEIRKEILGENHPDYIDTLRYLADLYQNQGKYSKAESIYLKVLKFNKDNLGNKNLEYAFSLELLASVYCDQEKYKEAEPLFLEALKIRQDISGVDDLGYASTLNHLGSLYNEQAMNKEALIYYLKSLEILKKKLGENNTDYATVIENIAIIYQADKDYVNALKFYNKVLDIRKRILGEMNPEYAQILHNIASLYSAQGILDMAEKLYLESLEINKEIFPENHPNYIQSLNNLAIVYLKEGKYPEAESLLLKVVQLNKNKFHKEGSIDIANIWSLSVVYRDFEQYKKCSIYLKKLTNINSVDMIQDFYGLSEKELMINIQSINRPSFWPLTFLYDLPNQYPEINISCFENELLLKNLSLRNTQRIRNSIQKSDNNSLKVKYKKFLENKKQIRVQEELLLDKNPEIIASLLTETDQIEKELTKESATFSQFKKSLSITWNQVKLKKHEVVIDLVAFDYYKKKTIHSESKVYGAFIVKKDSKFPKFISLFEEKQLDSLLLRNKSVIASARLNNQYKDKAISDLFLKPLENEFKNITTIYLSPSGLGHQIDFAALPIYGNQTLGEKYNLHIISSPTELLDYKVSSLIKKGNIDLLLYGGIDYNKSNPKAEIDKEIVEHNNDIAALRIQSGISGFDYLNGTNDEINQIQLKGNLNGFTTTVYKESEATEESIKQLDGRTTPYVLHLATHGFFFPDPKQEIPNDIFTEKGKSKIYKASDDPMMRSGLLLAGANNYWGKTTGNTTTEDGILTASEISNLDLSACQLVVLSACETGLGEVKGSEGVFGLQRAFKMAGVKNIIMSLWKVPDTQTAELFDIFYSECFAGKSIHEAFQSSQTKMKAKYSPYYWAGFVLLE